MRILLATYLGILLGIPLFFIGAAWGPMTLQGAGCLGALAFIFLFVLRCPRCWALSWTSRLFRGRAGFLFQYALPPTRCQVCGLDFRKHNLLEKFGWN